MRRRQWFVMDSFELHGKEASLYAAPSDHSLSILWYSSSRYIYILFIYKLVVSESVQIQIKSLPFLLYVENWRQEVDRKVREVGASILVRRGEAKLLWGVTRLGNNRLEVDEYCKTHPKSQTKGEEREPVIVANYLTQLLNRRGYFRAYILSRPECGLPWRKWRSTQSFVISGYNVREVS